MVYTHNKLRGLGLKYCVATPKLAQNIKQCLLKLAYKIRTKQYLLQHNSKSSGAYIPQIYIRNPPSTSLDIKNRITDFD